MEYTEDQISEIIKSAAERSDRLERIATAAMQGILSNESVLAANVREAKQSIQALGMYPADDKVSEFTTKAVASAAKLMAKALIEELENDNED